MPSKCTQACYVAARLRPCERHVGCNQSSCRAWLETCWSWAVSGDQLFPHHLPLVHGLRPNPSPSPIPAPASCATVRVCVSGNLANFPECCAWGCTRTSSDSFRLPTTMGRFPDCNALISRPLNPICHWQHTPSLSRSRERHPVASPSNLRPSLLNSRAAPTPLAALFEGCGFPLGCPEPGVGHPGEEMPQPA